MMGVLLVLAIGLQVLQAAAMARGAVAGYRRGIALLGGALGALALAVFRCDPFWVVHLLSAGMVVEQVVGVSSLLAGNQRHT